MVLDQPEQKERILKIYPDFEVLDSEEAVGCLFVLDTEESIHGKIKNNEEENMAEIFFDETDPNYLKFEMAFSEATKTGTCRMVVIRKTVN